MPRTSWPLPSLLTALLLSSPAIAGAESRIKVQDTFDTTKIPRPASFQVTIPKDQRGTFMVSTALLYAMLTGPSELSPSLEWQKNSVVKSPQDVFKAGFRLDLNIGDLTEQSWKPILFSALNYKYDGLKKVSGGQFALLGTIAARGKAGDPRYFYLPNTITKISQILSFQYSPSLGLEAEGRSSSPPVYRATLGVQTEFYPAPDHTNHRIQLTADYRYRRGSREEGGHRDHPNFAADINIYLLGDSNPEAGQPVAGVGAGYVIADNPAEEMARQQFGRLVLRLKF